MSKVIMIQGTMSNVGKSLISAGLCRVFRQDGFRVAPFKSQNMALNSFATPEGLEIGRAQAMQAEASGIEPSVLMNPILLKPTGNSSSQLIVNGRSIGDMTAREYFAFKTSLIPNIKESFYKLAEDNDVIVIEGAGSPAEINLRHQDIVNMGLAEMLDTPVVLVGDIDRGGVFAQLLGTYLLFSDKERERVKGLIVNKFRGDKTLLTPGFEMIKDKLPVPFIGVIPYENLGLEDEDSLSDRLVESDPRNAKEIDIAAIRLPWLSNFTDLDVFEQFERVSVRYVNQIKDFGNPDLIVIPGSKNTISDLRWLKSSGMGELIVNHANCGTPVIGICGGYQILGSSVEDPLGVEEGGTEQGLNLLPVKTIMAGEKKTLQFDGSFVSGGELFDELKGLKLTGYEIHMGSTDVFYDKAKPFTSEGTGICFGNIYGSYIHGLFDERGVASTVVKCLSRRKGLDYPESELGMALPRREFKEKKYDELANLIRGNIDMKYIYEMMQLEVKHIG